MNVAISCCKGYELWLVRLVWSGIVTIDTVGMQHVYVWQCFKYYELGWSHTWELVATGVTYSQSHCKYFTSKVGDSLKKVENH